MELSEQHSDALAELINIGFSRTAASLSELTGNRVILEPPRVQVYDIGQLFFTLSDFLPADVATVHQIFGGPIAGDAMLLLDYDGAVKLIELLTDEQVRSNRLGAPAREVLTEIGNILLSACLSVFGNLLQVHVSFSVPRLHLESLDAMLRSLAIQQEGVRYALVVHTAFRMRDSAVSGFLVLALGVASLERLIMEVEGWEQRQGQ